MNNLCAEKTDSEIVRVFKRRRDLATGEKTYGRKRTKFSPEVSVSDAAGESDFFDNLPDDLVVSILCKLSSTALSPADFINVLMTYVSSSIFSFRFEFVFQQGNMHFSV